MSRTGWCWVVIFGSVLIAFALDSGIQQFSQNPALHHLFLDRFFHQVEPLGRAVPYGVCISLVVVLGVILRDRRSLLAGIEVTLGYGSKELIVPLVKNLFGRVRPLTTLEPYQFFTGGDSFISGHTISIFTLAAILSLNYSHIKITLMNGRFTIKPIAIIVFLIATLVGIERIYDNRHWASDVVVGALAGYALGWTMFRLGEWLRFKWAAPAPTTNKTLT